ncbi:MAG: class I SAM-dependent methyltransferase [bacterium]
MDADKKTVEYFDRYTPRYCPGRFNFAIRFINLHAHKKSTLVDIGCGGGDIIEYVKNNTSIWNVSGMDISPNYLAQVKKRFDCDIFLGSVLDGSFIRSIQKKFDFVLMGAVLHHLVGNTRTQSKRNAESAVRNAFTLVKEGGWLIIVEPVFYPSVTMTILFYLKRFITKVTSKRVYIFDTWNNNIGAPVVSYYTNEELDGMIKCANISNIVVKHMKDETISILWRAGGIKRKTETTIVAQRKITMIR